MLDNVGKKSAGVRACGTFYFELLNIHLFRRVGDVFWGRDSMQYVDSPNGRNPKNCPTSIERVSGSFSLILHWKLRVRISTFPTTTTSCFSSPRILATLVVPFARARGLQFGLSLILRFFLLIHCNTKHDQCIIFSELVHPKNKQVLQSVLWDMGAAF